MPVSSTTLQNIALRTGRYNFVDDNRNNALTGRGTTIGGPGVPIKQAPISQIEWNLQNDSNLSVDSQIARLREEAKQRDAGAFEREKRALLAKMDVAKVKFDRIKQRAMLGQSVGNAPAKDIEELLSSIEAKQQEYKEARNAISDAKTLDDLKTIKFSNGQTADPNTWMAKFSGGTIPANQSEPTAQAQVNQPTGGVEGVSTPNVAPEGRNTSRVLSTIRGGKHAMAGAGNAPVKPEVQKTPEQIKQEARQQEFIKAGYSPEEARVAAYAAPEGTIIPKDQTMQAGSFTTIAQEKAGQPPVQITDKATLDAIEAAKTPEEKQAIIDKWNMEKTQEAANANPQFKKEADKNNDGVIDAKEAGQFQESHATATYNLAAQAAGQKKMDPGRQKLLEDIAKGNGTDTGASGQKYQTVITKQEQDYMKNFKTEGIVNKAMQDFNVQLNGWNTAQTKEQRAAAKLAMKQVSDNLKESNPEAWKIFQEKMQPQIAKVEEKVKKPTQEKDTTPKELKPEVKPTETIKPEATPTENNPKVGAGKVNAGGETKIDMIEKGNDQKNLGQGQPQQVGTEKNIIVRK